MVNRQTLRADLMAGLTNAVVVLPQGVAFALIAGLPPEYGLYTAMVTPIIAALFGSSWHLISGPTTAISIVVFSTISGFAEPGSEDFVRLALTLTFLAGVYQLAFGLAQLGKLVNFVSHTVVVGFTTGAAILIATSQMKHILGLDVPRGENFIHTWEYMILHIADTNFYVMGIALTTLVVALLIKKIRPTLPNLLIGMLAGGVLSYFLQADAQGVKLVGALPNHLPVPALPDLSFATIKQLMSSAFAVALLGLIEAVSISRSIASKSRQRIDGNQEFIGQGMSNACGSFFSAYAGSGSFTRSGLNYTSGARTPLSAIFAAVCLALILMTVAPLFAYLPIPAMGGVILLVAWNLIHVNEIKEIFRAGRSEWVVLLVTFFSTLFLHLEFAIYAGVLLSLILYLNRTAKPKVLVQAPNPKAYKRRLTPMTSDEDMQECPQMKIVSLEGSLFFGAVEHVTSALERIRTQNHAQAHLVLICEGMNFIDLSGSAVLKDEAERRRDAGGDLVLVGVKDEVYSLFDRYRVFDHIKPASIYASKADAIGQTAQLLDTDICSRCSKRIFRECEELANRDTDSGESLWEQWLNDSETELYDVLVPPALLGVSEDHDEEPASTEKERK